MIHVCINSSLNKFLNKYTERTLFLIASCKPSGEPYPYWQYPEQGHQQSSQKTQSVKPYDLSITVATEGDAPGDDDWIVTLPGPGEMKNKGSGAKKGGVVDGEVTTELAHVLPEYDKVPTTPGVRTVPTYPGMTLDLQQSRMLTKLSL